MAAAGYEVRPSNRPPLRITPDCNGVVQNWVKQDVQSGLVKWDTMMLALERDHNEKLSPKIRRALLLNILPKALQSRILEHLDRLPDYTQVFEKVVSLVQSQRNPDAMDCSLIDGGFQSVQSEEETIPEAEGYTEEE